MASRVSIEFKHEVVQVALTSGLSKRQIASDSDIGFSTLGRWIKEERELVLSTARQRYIDLPSILTQISSRNHCE